jgi:coniferyl-aldehyde dehydrogenase
MRAAANNLTPVTLELGGKSPAIVHPSFPMEKAAERIAYGKTFNAGQTCIAPDYVLAEESQAQALAHAIRDQIAVFYPTLGGNADYTSIVSDRHYQRLEKLVQDAVSRGATAITVDPDREARSPRDRKFAPTILLHVNDDMAVMQEEIFGPVLPIVTYKEVDEAIAYVNAHPRPLALYYFDTDGDRQRQVLRDTVSGGAAINDCLLHYVQEDLPFGGVGASGMGSYHGREGFETFSHKKAVFHQSRFNVAKLLLPPYGARIDKLLKMLIG